MSMKKIISVLCTASVLFLSSPLTVSAKDLSGDGNIDVFDFQMMKSGFLNIQNDYEGIGYAADITGDSILDVKDITLMKQYILGDVSELPPIQPEETTEEMPPFTTETTSPIVTTTPVMSDITSEQITETTITPAPSEETTTTTAPAPMITPDDVPAEYKEALEWIMTNRIEREQSVAKYNTIFDQIIAGQGTLNFVVRWQSYKQITLEQRQNFEKVIDEAVNSWGKYLAGYDEWPYDHIDVKITGWAVLDKNVLLDLQPDEVVYDNLISDYDSTYDTSNGYEIIPDKLPSAPDEISRFWHFSNNTGYNYPNGLESRFDMYLWATQGFPSIGGCGGDWGQRLSDDAYMNMADSGSNIHVLVHEVGHGFGLTDFYGGEGEIDGYPVGGFPGNGTSIMMAGSSMEITDFDGWMLRYAWSEIKDENGRF